MLERFVLFSSFIGFTGLVGFLTWWLTRKDKHDTSAGYFLAGRTLTFGFIAGSLLLTNLSTEQLVGLNGDAFADGLCVMAWEVIAGMSLVIMALFFLPRYLKSGIATIPQFLEERFDAWTRSITSAIFIIAYAGILLPIILYTGASGLIGILNVQELAGLPNKTVTLWVMVWMIGIIGSIYAIFGGLRSVAVSDTLNGFGLLVGGVIIIVLGLYAVDPNGPLTGLSVLKEQAPEKFNSLGTADTTVPFSTLFTGVLLLNLFYWCTNQQIIQRTFGASSLKEGQKGVLLAGVFKILAPLILVFPGMVAFFLFGMVPMPEQQRVPIKDIISKKDGIALVGSITPKEPQEVILIGEAASEALETQSVEEAQAKVGQFVYHDNEKILVEKVVGPEVVITQEDPGTNGYYTKKELDERGIDYDSLISPRHRVDAYGALVRRVLPTWLAGFFAAVVAGAILSSFNSALNSTATLFSLGVYQHVVPGGAEDKSVIRAGKIFGGIIAIVSMTVAPLLAEQQSIFGYLQKMNGLYFIPIFSVVLVGMLTRRVPPMAANFALVLGFTVIALGYFVPFFDKWVKAVHEFHFLGIVFATLILMMLVIGQVKPTATPYEQKASGDVDLTPWNLAWPVGIGLVLIVVGIYVTFADLSAVLGK
ncbi:MAG: solute:sodium symporter family transporter [Gemmataceae bacterium]